jgi:tetratricopeptide (TPR) repeat protein
MIIPARHRLSAPLRRLPLELLLLCGLLLLPAAAWAGDGAAAGGGAGAGNATLPAAGAGAFDPTELLNAGHADEAIRLLTPQATGNNAAAFNYLGRVYFALEDWDNAVRNCERAVQLEPRNAMYQLWLGRSYGEKANVSNLIAAFPLARKTVAAFAAAHALDGQNMAIVHDLAEYYSEAPLIVGGGIKKAFDLAAELAHEHPTDAAWVRARAAANAGHYEEAEREYTEAIRLDHDSATTYLDLAHFLRGRKSWDRFQQTVERAMQSAQIHPADRYDAAELLLRTDRNLDEAARQMRAYIQGEHTEEEDPVFRAHFLLGEILLKTGDTHQAAAEYQAALALASSYRPAAEALRRLGQR